jgi:hypothetical protein
MKWLPTKAKSFAPKNTLNCTIDLNYNLKRRAKQPPRVYT